MEEKGLVMWINIALNEGYFTFTSRIIKWLTLVSHYVANSLKNYVEQNYWFDLRRGRRLTHYSSPKNQTQVRNLNEILPSTKKVVFHYDFNNEVDNLLSPHITHIVFGMFFNQKVDHLPPNLIYVRFGKMFNQKIDNLPSSLLKLTLGYNFKNSIDHLPPNLTHLTLAWDFNHFITSLPPKVEQVIFGCFYNQPISLLAPHIQFLQRVSPYNSNIKKYQYRPPQ